MKRRIFLTFIVSLFTFSSWAQKFVTEKTFVTFFSDAAIEDITAENKAASGIFNSATNDIAFSIPIKEFEFAKSLMKEHFNEKYMDTEKYPKSTFRGKITGFDHQGQRSTKCQGYRPAYDSRSDKGHRRARYNRKTGRQTDHEVEIYCKTGRLKSNDPAIDVAEYCRAG